VRGLSISEALRLQGALDLRGRGALVRQRAVPDAPPGCEHADPWEVLGITRGAPKTEVKKAFRAKIRSAHPDSGGTNEEFQKVRWAYEAALSDEYLSSTRAGNADSSWGSVYGEQESRGPAPQGWDAANRFWEPGLQGSAANTRAPFATQTERPDFKRYYPGASQRSRHEQRYRAAAERARQEAEAELRDMFTDLPKHKADVKESSGAAGATTSKGTKRQDNVETASMDMRTCGTNWMIGSSQKAQPNRRSFATPWQAQSVGEASPSKKSAKKAKKKEASAKVEDMRVGKKAVWTVRGMMDVPVYMNSLGEKYYFMPFTEVKVEIPS